MKVKGILKMFSTKTSRLCSHDFIILCIITVYYSLFYGAMERGVHCTVYSVHLLAM